jgi:hypothetical protein
MARRFGTHLLVRRTMPSSQPSLLAGSEMMSELLQLDANLVACTVLMPVGTLERLSDTCMVVDKDP